MKFHSWIQISESGTKSTISVSLVLILPSQKVIFRELSLIIGFFQRYREKIRRYIKWVITKKIYKIYTFNKFKTNMKHLFFKCVPITL